MGPGPGFVHIQKNSKYFLNLEKTRCGKTAVRRLYDSTGKITVNPRSIINELRDNIKRYIATTTPKKVKNLLRTF